MDCKEFERLIPDFIARRQDFLTLQRFERHREQCKNCQEELVIQFLVSEGMQRLEEGDAFDLQSELDVRLAEAKRKMRLHGRFLRVGFWLELIAAMAVAAAVVMILL